VAYSEKIERILKSKRISVGDRIQVGKEEGILMPRVHGDPDTVVLKLDNGYNVGIKAVSAAQIIKIEPLKKPLEPQKVKYEHEPGKPKLLIIHTGGTIASKVDYRTGAVHPAFTPEELLTSIPELKKIANIETKLAMQIFSENMTPENWIKIANEIKNHLGRVDGIIVTHGTDTLHYTSAAISFLVQNPSVPIVFVGAQRSSDRPSSDASLNLICAAHYAVQGKPGVFICMHENTSDESCVLILGTKARKLHTSRRDAFKPINSKPFARVLPNGVIEFLDEERLIVTRTEFKIYNKLEPRVALVKIHPGSSPSILAHYREKGYKGVVIEGTGLGHTPQTWFEEIEKCIKKKMVLVMTSQCLYGRTNMNVYDTGRDLVSLGVIGAEDMLPETALVKLMWALAAAKDFNQAKSLMQTNVIGEIAPRGYLQHLGL
jgi:glutamyl-tRNA(Gln) amidotransferase subunit D